MTQDNQQEPANANKRTRNSDPEHRERIAQLVQPRSKLTPEEAALLRKIFPEIVEAHEERVSRSSIAHRSRGTRVQR